MVKTKFIAFKTKCFWRYGDNGFYLEDFEGHVYENRQGLWLKNPTGYVKITEDDITGEV